MSGAPKQDVFDVGTIFSEINTCLQFYRIYSELYERTVYLCIHHKFINNTYQERLPHVRRLLNKKNQGGYPDCPYHHPERKRSIVRKFSKKKKWWASRLNAFKIKIFKT
jgi:hypothetical protein